MAMKTPDWIIEGYDSKADYERQKNKFSTSSKQSDDSSTKAKGITSEGSGTKSQALSTSESGSEQKKTGKTFKIRECPKCKSDDVGLVLSNSDAEQGGGKEWECRKCKWKGKDINEKELTEKELMEYMDKKGEEVA